MDKINTFPSKVFCYGVVFAVASPMWVEATGEEPPLYTRGAPVYEKEKATACGLMGASSEFAAIVKEHAPRAWPYRVNLRGSSRHSTFRGSKELMSWRVSRRRSWL